MPRDTEDEPIYRADCPTRTILDQIGDKWSMMVLAVLRASPKRFNGIKRQLEGITQRVLTQTLRKLERNGMVVRRVIGGSPPGVEYSITPLGRSLQEPFAALYDWTLEHIDTIHKHQESYDRDAQTTTRRPD
ncbi:helix-turn-helix domain-containing protein [Myxococcus sp. MISCRS1]|jgi:DNA-binding HxlR family transcriptional regulator|uniref:winged helix-turn-helix transcriptional regulator n=1 Tax=Myxococcus TaxID=32 RepID=UPI001CBEB716|nr:MULTISPECIES: helix-turn-helix domain-containing protein [unclassified Myxococcus]MBZ4402366.1 helix-turn-helix transcriptional regulator [Myxococcus sp. AS-1-15]MBZ4412816.1 helix-turn-helix transcriptional regulator [Myxococcus sp. XM-1-1-1]MCY0997362.1 helix-turn-helix domain-containing protein [Myxococcus sp. MISCRS1]BDT32630.1 helix-turn-helix transcriptional regulator [Myxococcus sp. MH1]